MNTSRRKQRHVEQQGTRATRAKARVTKKRNPWVVRICILTAMLVGSYYTWQYYRTLSFGEEVAQLYADYMEEGDRLRESGASTEERRLVLTKYILQLIEVREKVSDSEARYRLEYDIMAAYTSISDYEAAIHWNRIALESAAYTTTSEHNDWDMQMNLAELYGYAYVQNPTKEFEDAAHQEFAIAMDLFNGDEIKPLAKWNIYNQYASFLESSGRIKESIDALLRLVEYINSSEGRTEPLFTRERIPGLTSGASADAIMGEAMRMSIDSGDWTRTSSLLDHYKETGTVRGLSWYHHMVVWDKNCPDFLYQRALAYLDKAPEEDEHIARLRLFFLEKQLHAHSDNVTISQGLSKMLNTRNFDRIRHVDSRMKIEIRVNILLARILKNMGMKEQSSIHYRNALQLAPDGKQSQNIEKEMSEY